MFRISRLQCGGPCLSQISGRQGTGVPQRNPPLLEGKRASRRASGEDYAFLTQ